MHEMVRIKGPTTYICKHIHLLVRSLSPSDGGAKASNIPPDSKMEQKQKVLQKMQKTGQCPDNSKRCQCIENDLVALSGHVKVITDVDLLHDVSTIIKSALNLIKSRQKMKPLNMPPVNNQPSNKLIDPQRKCFLQRKSEVE